MFESLDLLPADPLLGLIGAFREDNNPDKVDLGVGVYQDDAGNTPVFRSVKLAEQMFLEQETTKNYLGPAGDPGFNRLIQALVLGAAGNRVLSGRVSTIQTPGACGALSVTGELIYRCKPEATVWISDPTWANHLPLLQSKGLRIKQYPYYCFADPGLRFDEMLALLKTLGKDDVVLLHGCCHNPTGADLTPDQWREIALVAQTTGFIPLVDLAYQGLGVDPDQDAYGVRLLAESVPEIIICYSCSKNFGLYRDRVGALIIIGTDATAVKTVISHVNNITRRHYTMPPNHGAAVVGQILAMPELKQMWTDELLVMRRRIKAMRSLLADTLKEKNAPMDFGFIRYQQGMFSLLGLSGDEVRYLRDQYGIYMPESGRINICGITRRNVDYLSDAIIKILNDRTDKSLKLQNG